MRCFTSVTGSIPVWGFVNQQHLFNIMKIIKGTHNENYVRLNGVHTGFINIPFDTKNKKNFVVTTLLPIKGGSKILNLRCVNAKNSLAKFNNCCYVDDGAIIVNTTEKLKRPLFKISFVEDFSEKWCENELYTNPKFRKMKRQSIPDRVPCKKTKTKIAWGVSSENQACVGLHHILESHSYKVGKGSLVLDGSFFVYREKEKADLVVAQCYLDDDQDDIVLWRKIKSKKTSFGSEQYYLLVKCWKKIDKIFASSTYTSRLITEALMS